MTTIAPHFLLFSESTANVRLSDRQDAGRWRFVLESIDGDATIAAGDAEPDTFGERLELLAVVRGLEALDQPSMVTLVTTSDYVRRGLRYGLNEWKGNQWRWERFGRMVPVKNGDLWRRVDQALCFHQVHCRLWRFDLPRTRSDDQPERWPEQQNPEEQQPPESASTGEPATTPHRCDVAQARRTEEPEAPTMVRAGLRWCRQVTAPHGRRPSARKVG